MLNTNAEILWNYYKILAEKEHGQNFSTEYFYDGEDELNPLTRAFLADDNAMKELRVEKKVSEDAVRASCRNYKYNESQINAIVHAINYPITIVQGPPGTGKTETIKNLMVSLREYVPNASIAMVSSNSEAIENVRCKMDECESLKDCYALLGNISKRNEFLKTHGIYSTGGKECQCTPELLKKFPIILSTIHSLRKCFGSPFDNQFDYVIVDECSQVSTRLGILAMASAKHLVLFGDDNQLSPIHNYSVDDGVTDKVKKIGEYYLDEDENSFMHACDMRFGDFAGHIMLNEHYRCHPKIIEFCNKNFYDNKLQVKTKDDGEFPVRIRWYEGDYWECIYSKTFSDDSSKRYKADNYNKKQIRIFVEEEYPQIVEKILKDRSYSACVLSPYKYQLQLLSEAIKEYNEMHEINFEEDDCRIKENKSEDGENFNEIYQFTIHKAQGREYEYVCVMPVIDVETKTSWHQSARITNVAVSRAKKELCYITSSNWMDREKQLEFLADGEHGEMRKLCNFMLQSSSPKITAPDADDKDKCLPKLFNYVIENEGLWKDSGYGLHRTKLRSVFDVNCICGYVDDMYRKYELSVPELCMLNALLLKFKETDSPLKCRFHVPLKSVIDVDSIDDIADMVDKPVDDVKNYISNAHFDIVLYRGNEIAYIIEVDGSGHRGPVDFDKSGSNVDWDKFEIRCENDKLKDELVKNIGQNFEERYVRIPTDGTTDNEIEKIIQAIQKADGNNVITPEFKEGFELQEFDEEFVEKQQKLNALKDHLMFTFERFNNNDETKKLRNGMQTDPEQALEDYPNLNYDIRGQADNYDYKNEWTCQWYMLRYSMAYAFEYYVMYLIALRQFDENDSAKVYSFGCGSGLDSFSLYYAQQKLAENNLGVYNDISYRGTDIAEWCEDYRIDPAKFISNSGMYYGENGNMENFLEHKDDPFAPNILFFPKVLSELDEIPLSTFCNNLVNLDGDRIVLCVSYRSFGTLSCDKEKTDMVIAPFEEIGYKRVELKGLDEIKERFDLLEPNNKDDWDELTGDIDLSDKEKKSKWLKLKKRKGVFVFKKFRKDSKYESESGKPYSEYDNTFAINSTIWDEVGKPGISQYCKTAKNNGGECDKNCDLNLKDKCPHSAIINTNLMCFEIIVLEKEK